MERIWTSLCILLNLFSIIKANIQVWEQQLPHNETIIDHFDDLPAEGWAYQFDKYSFFIGFALSTNPPDGCLPIPALPPNQSFFALISRGKCNFDLKAYYAQKAGYKAVIIYDSVDEQLIRMRGGQWSEHVNIPVVFIGKMDGLKINESYVYTKDRNITISINGSGNRSGIDQYIWPFVGSVALVFIILIVFSLYKWTVDRRRRHRNRLSVKSLNQIPVKKFLKGDPYDVCAVCLDEYEEEDELRILPCNHAYHAKCVDPWLTRAKKQCPVCKRKVVVPGSEDSSQTSSQAETTEPEASQENPEASQQNPDSEVPASGDEEEEETTPLVLRGDEDVDVRSGPSLLQRLRNLLHRASVNVEEPHQPQTSGYGSLSQIPPEFNPTLPPPPSRSLHPVAPQLTRAPNPRPVHTVYSDSSDEEDPCSRPHPSGDVVVTTATLVLPSTASNSADEELA